MSQYVDLRIAATGQVHQNFLVTRLVQLIDQGRITPQDLIRPIGTEDWKPISAFPQLAQRVEQASQSEVSATQMQVDPDAERELEESISMSTEWPTADLEEPTMDMLPMIDVIFQLLIFFMFTSTLDVATAIEVPQVEHGMGVTPEGIQLILVNGEGQYYLGDTPKDDHKMESIEELVNKVSENADLAEEPLDVVINAHKTAKHGVVRLLVEQLNKQGGNEIGRIKIGVEEKK